MGFEFLVGKPNDKARPICSRIGYQAIGEAQGRARPTDAGATAQLRGYPDTSLYKDEVLTLADHRFEELWAGNRRQYHIIGEKTATFLNWRYSTFKEQNYHFYCLFGREDNRLKGYVVYYVTRWGFFIADLFCENAQSPLLDQLLLGFAALANREGHPFVAVSYMGAPWFEDRLSKIGFHPDKNSRKLMVCVDPKLPASYRDEILDRRNWFIFGGEMDLF